MEVRQAELERTMGGTFLVTWIPADLARVGATLVHKSGVEWHVRQAYKLTMNHDDLAHEWRVGGLS